MNALVTAGVRAVPMLAGGAVVPAAIPVMAVGTVCLIALMYVSAKTETSFEMGNKKRFIRMGKR